MRAKSSVILAAVAIVVLALGWYFGPHQTPGEQQHTSAGALLFPGLTAPLEKAARIELTHGGKTFAVARKGDVWVLPDQGSYPVKPGMVHALLAGLTELRVAGKRTTNPADFKALGVADPKQPGSTGSLLTVLDASGHPIVTVIVGNQRYGMAGDNQETVYVRRPGENQSWLAEGALSVDSDPSLWIDHTIANIDHSRITRIEVARGEEHLVFAPENDKLTLLEPKDHPPLDTNKIDDVWRALEYLSFSDVSAGSALPGKEIGHSVFTMSDGTTLTATLATEEKKLWVRFAVNGTSKDAASLKAKLADWNFEFGAWRESTLLPGLADIATKQAAAKP